MRPEDRAQPRPAHPASLSEAALVSQCEMGKQRTGGPGGQHRNKVETAVTLLHEPTGIEAQASERRSVTENKRVAIRRLRLALAVEHRVHVGLGEVRSALWLDRSRGGKIACNAEHWDFPSLLAEAMDVVFACDGDVSRAAARLAVTASQLVKLVKEHPPAMQRLNQWRTERGLHALK
jgi:RF-1 domain